MYPIKMVRKAHQLLTNSLFLILSNKSLSQLTISERTNGKGTLIWISKFYNKKPRLCYLAGVGNNCFMQ